MTVLNNNTATSKTPKTIITPKPALGVPEVTGELEDLLALMARLRSDCPWDQKQTNHSLIPYAIEEAYELSAAVQTDDDEDIKSELGDVLLQVVFHCQLYAEQGRFDINDVITTLQQKLIRRHPHVFETQALKDDAAVKARWDEIKAQEQQADEARGKPRRRLDAIKAGSALMQAQELQKQAARLGFDWDGVDGAFDKLEEEINELKNEVSNQTDADIQTNIAAIEKELGDCIFGLVNVARKLGLDAEAATLTCVHKFKSRFGYIETQLEQIGKRFEDSDIEEMDALWEAAKQHERR